MSGLSDVERDQLLSWDSGYFCACTEDTCPVVPCTNDRTDLCTAVERIVAARETRLRETIAQEIETDRDAANWAKTYRNGLDHAASIVRGRCP